MFKKLTLLGVLLVTVQALYAQTHSVTLTWTAPITTLNVGYNVYRATGTGTFTKIQGSIGAATPSYVDSSVTAGTAYVYYVTAYDTTGVNTESVPSNKFTAVIPTGGGTNGQTPPPSGLTGTVQ